ncbi:MAG: RNA polymerase sigma factor [Flavobacteriaceae bacterium]|nr:RNA polymerase sigma factor [Flavobacteriaceae bacterium]
MEQSYDHINQLIERCRNKEHKAQMEIYKLYYKAMFNTSLRIVNDKFEAEDIMQESFLKAFTKLDTFNNNGLSTFGSWLKRIVINNSLTALKKNKKIDKVPYEFAENINFEDDVCDYSSVKCSEILKVISTLKSNYRIALTLNLIEGYDNEEIAHIMEISNENVRTTISRAKNKLRELMTLKQFKL